MSKLTKILNIATYVIFGITAVLTAMYYFGGEVPNQTHTTPVHTDEMIVWAYILLAIAAGASLLFPIVRFFTNPKEAKKGLMAMGAIAVVVLLSYSISDGTLLDLPGYTGADNEPATLEFADTILFTMYFLGIGAIVSIFATELLRKFR